ncbi:MAG: Nif3-like dinuclear metal center hexameric protein [Ruminococcus sp.]|nr:Nif3-like dinuclear metal center hexameric protein [Ruminococcus sp.]
MLDTRLQTCFDLVGGEGIVCDVGTDHALLAAELIRSEKCRRVIASDIKEGPLDSARRTVERLGVADKVELVLSDGLASVPLDGVSDVVIAGMGGETIAAIISNALESGRCSAGLSWVLQPMTKPEYLRRAVYELGLKITEECAVEDGDKIYVVMRAVVSGETRCLTEFEARYGFFADDDEMGRRYRSHEASQMEKVSAALMKSGRQGEAVHYHALAYKLENGAGSVPLDEICTCLNSLYPFGIQEKWDNSGLLVNAGGDCRKVLVTLDIDKRAVREAAIKSADLMVSHHPVIFSPLSSVSSEMPVYQLIRNNISAICLHTNVDKSPSGTNGLILRELRSRFGFDGEPEYINSEECGYVCDLAESVSAAEFAEVLKSFFGCKHIRVSAGAGTVKKVAFCTGAGGSFLADVAEKGCDTYVTGEIKHDAWLSAEDYGVSVFECGHFHTENPMIWEFRRVLEERFPQLDIETAESSVDPCEYL